MIKYLSLIILFLPLAGMQPQSKKVADEWPVSRELQGIRFSLDLKKLLAHYILALPGVTPFVESKLGVPHVTVLELRDDEKPRAVFLGDEVLVAYDPDNRHPVCFQLHSTNQKNPLIKFNSDLGLKKSGINYSRRLLALSYNGSVRVWNLARVTDREKLPPCDQRKSVHEFALDCLINQLPCKEDSPLMLRLNEQGLKLAVAFKDRIELWNIFSEGLLQSLHVDEEWTIKRMLFDSSGEMLITAQDGRDKAVISVYTGRETKSWNTEHCIFILFEVNTSGDTLITYELEDTSKNVGNFKIWDIATTDCKYKVVCESVPDAAWPVFNRNRGILAMVLSKRKIALGFMDAIEKKGALFQKELHAYKFDFSPTLSLSESGYRLAVDSYEAKCLLIFSVDTGELLHVIRHDKEDVDYYFKFDAAGNRLVSSVEKVIVWNFSLPSCLANVTLDQALLLRAIYEVIILKRLIELRRARRQIVRRNSDDTILDTDSLPELKLDLDGKYEHLKSGYAGLADPLKNLFSQYVKYTPLLQEIA